MSQNQVKRARKASMSRQTSETEVKIEINLDGTGRHTIQSGIPFLDHMLAQVAVHGLVDLEVRATGDLQIDPHHTIEDVGLTLGQAVRQALGDKKGIVRMASFEVPMDEALARVALDFSGRAYTVYDAEWTLPSVGGIPNTLFQHFFESFAQSAGCNLHARVWYGRDDHHKAEALFKAFGRALDQATQLDYRRLEVPSSKGMLA